MTPGKHPDGLPSSPKSYEQSRSAQLRPNMTLHDHAESEGPHVDPFADDLQLSSDVALSPLSSQTTTSTRPLNSPIPPVPIYRTYRRRWFGLAQLTLLNIIVSWDWLTYAPVSTSSAKYFSVTESQINWLSTAFLFAFVVATPTVMWTLNHGGPKPAIVASSTLILLGNWIRYAGTRTRGGNFGAVMFGQILIGLAQPFVLAAPTRYSDLWFSDRGKIAATALASLANPFGGALGQLIDPLLATKPSDIPNMTLIVAIISTVATFPSPFLPRRPPTPPSSTSVLAATNVPSLDLSTLGTLFTSNTSFLLLFLPFAIYVSAFNALSSLLNAIMYPYGFDETAAGLTGALLIIVGLLTAAITSPILDRSPKLRLPVLKILCVALSAMYLAFVFAPPTRTVAMPYAIAAILGAASFSLVPLSLEMLAEVTRPISPEISSCICWAAGQLGGGIFIIVMDALQDKWKGEPKNNMKGGLVFLVVCCWLVLPLPLLLGILGSRQGHGGGGLRIG